MGHRPQDAVRRNLIALAGMTIAVAATLVMIRLPQPMAADHAPVWWWVLYSVCRRRGRPGDAMPQLVAFFNGIERRNGRIAVGTMIPRHCTAFPARESPTVVTSLFQRDHRVESWRSGVLSRRVRQVAEIISGQEPVGLGKGTAAGQPVRCWPWPWPPPCGLRIPGADGVTANGG